MKLDREIADATDVAAYDGRVATSSSRGGVGMTPPAARDLAQRGIRVDTITPGIVDSPTSSRSSSTTTRSDQLRPRRWSRDSAIEPHRGASMNAVSEGRPEGGRTPSREAVS